MIQRFHIRIVFIFFSLFKAERLSATFEALGDVINYHHHGEVSRGNPEKDKGDVIQHRLAFIGVTGFTSRLLKQLVPVQQVTFFFI